MAVWAGLGAAADYVADDISMNRKADLQKKLEEERMEAQDKYAQMREQREAERLENTADADESRFIKNPAGIWVEQRRSATGKVLEEVQAPQSEIDRINRETESEKLSIEKIVADIAKAKAEAQWTPLLKEAQLGNYNAQAEASRARAAYSYSGIDETGARRTAPKTQDWTNPSPGSLQEFLGKPDDKGKKKVDPALNRDFQAFRNKNNIADGDQALSMYVQQLSQAEQVANEARSDPGTPEYVARTLEGQIRRGETPNVKTVDPASLAPEQKEKMDAGLRALARARAAIAAGTLSAEEAREQLKNRGFSRLAMQIE